MISHSEVYGLGNALCETFEQDETFAINRLREGLTRMGSIPLSLYGCERFSQVVKWLMRYANGCDEYGDILSLALGNEKAIEHGFFSECITLIRDAYSDYHRKKGF